MPTEPGPYRDARGDLWLLHDDGRWQHMERRLTGGRQWPVRDYSPVSAQALEALGRIPGSEVLPLTRIDAADTL